MKNLRSFATLLLCAICGLASAQDTYTKITSTDDLESGAKYLIVYEGDEAVAFDGSLTSLDAVSNNKSVTISNNTITTASTDGDYSFTITESDGSYTIQSASGYYIGQTSNANKLLSSTSTVYTNTITFTDGNVNIVASGGPYLRYNSASNQTRFRYYKSSSYTGQQAIALYKIKTGDDSKTDVTLAWSETSVSYDSQSSEAFVAPTLTAKDDEGTDILSELAITYTSSEESVATVAEDGTVTIVGEGTTTIKAASAADDSYNAASASYTLTVYNPHATTTAFAYSTSKVAIGSTIDTNTATTVDYSGTELTDYTITYTSSDESIATVDANGVVTGVAEGEATITATYAGDDNYNASSATMTVTVYGVTYYKKATTITSGKKYIIAAISEDDETSALVMYPLSSTKTYGYLSAGTKTITDDQIGIENTYDDAFTITYDEDEDAYTIMDPNSRYMYIGYNSKKSAYFTSFNAGESPESGQYWSIEIADDGTATITNDLASSWIQYSTSYSSYGCYDSQSGITPCLWEEVTVETSTISFTASNKGNDADNKIYVATYVAPFDIDIAALTEAGVTAYALSVDGSSVTYTEIKENIPAGTALVVSAGEEGDYTVTSTTEEVTGTIETALQAGDGSTTVGDGKTIYTLQRGSESKKLGWYLKTSGSVIAANKCYLVIESSDGVKDNFLGFDTTTGISSIAAEAGAQNGTMYNVAGQIVDQNYKGIVIIGGKKYLNK